MLAKQLEFVLGARIPSILTSRAEKTLASSCAIATPLARQYEG